MPAVYDSLMSTHNHDSRVAWRLSFVIPCVLLIIVAIACFFTCNDCPTGAWADRHSALSASLLSRNSSRTLFSAMPSAVNSTAHLGEKKAANHKDSGVTVREESVNWSRRGSAATTDSRISSLSPSTPPPSAFTRQGLISILCPSTLMLAAVYATTFGSALAVNSIIVPYYMASAPQWDEMKAGHYAAGFGLLNLVSRPTGGIVADLLYRKLSKTSQARAIHGKKYWMLGLCVVQGGIAMALGLSRPRSIGAILGCMFALAFFMQAANGAVCESSSPALSCVAVS